ncbi:MAG: hypothetical protein QGH40_00030 [bacterium]|nr:hypothetical protein [bacterium]
MIQLHRKHQASLAGLALFVSGLLLILGTMLPEPATACSVELSVLLAFQKLDPQFTTSIRTIDRVLRLKAVPISKGEDVDLSLEDIQPALDEWAQVQENYNEDTPPSFFYDKPRWKEHWNWLETLFSTLERRVKAGEKEKFHDTVWAMEDIFMNIYQKRGKRDPRIIHSQLLKLKDSPEEEILTTVTMLIGKIDEIAASIIPKDSRERAIAKNTMEIGQELASFLDQPRSELKDRLPGVIKRISILENLILNLRWFEDKGTPADIRWEIIKRDL